MPKRRRTPNRRGIITVLAMVGAAILLIAVGSLFKGFPRRVPASPQADAPAKATHDEVDDGDRAALEKILRGSGDDRSR
jgi:hypothetical protein